MNSLEVNQLSKSYINGKTRVDAIKNLSFEVGSNELFGIIGPDGAGKTTLFRILSTLLNPDSGTARVLGLDTVKDYKQIRKKVGYMPGRFSLYQDLTVEENLEFFATIFNTNIQKNYESIEPIYKQIEPFKTRKAGALSGGMKQKLALSCALIHKPEILFLDEPTTGVDPVSRKEFWEMLANLKSFGLSILVSTPYMDEAERCDRIALIQKGEFLGIDTAAGISASFPKPLFQVYKGSNHHLRKALLQHPAVRSCYPFGENLHITFQDSVNNPQTVLTEAGFPELDARRIDAGIEDCFMELMPLEDEIG